MTNNPHRCVIDAAGNYVDFVLVRLELDDEGNTVEKINTFKGKPDYILKDGERLVEASVPSYPEFVKPVWSDISRKFEETATPDEIEAAKIENAPPIIKEPVSDLEIAFAEYVIETEQRLVDLEEKTNA